MNPVPPRKRKAGEQPPHLDVEKVNAAMRRAARRAWRRAAENGTPVAVVENGEVVWKWPGDDALSRSPDSTASANLD